MRRLVLRSTPADQAPEYHARTHPDLRLIAGDDLKIQRIVMRVLDGAAAIVDQERRIMARREQELADERAEMEASQASKARDDGLPEDMAAALEDAIRAFGRTGHIAARQRLGDKVYDAVKGLGHGCGWGWLCQQPALAIAGIAAKVDRALGRGTQPPKPFRDRHGGGTHHRNTTPTGRVAVSPELLADLLLPQARAMKLYVPIEELKDLRLTAADWNALFGRVAKKVSAGFVVHSRFGAYLLASARRWEQDHPIKTRS